MLARLLKVHVYVVLWAMQFRRQSSTCPTIHLASPSISADHLWQCPCRCPRLGPQLSAKFQAASAPKLHPSLSSLKGESAQEHLALDVAGHLLQNAQIFSQSACVPRVCYWWFPNGGLNLVRRSNSPTPFELNLIKPPLSPILHLSTFLTLNLTSASSGISNHGLEAMLYGLLGVYRPLAPPSYCDS